MLVGRFLFPVFMPRWDEIICSRSRVFIVLKQQGSSPLITRKQISIMSQNLALFLLWQTLQQKVLITDLHVFENVIIPGVWASQRFSARRTSWSERSHHFVTPFIFHPVFFLVYISLLWHWMWCEWASHLPPQYYSVQLTGQFPEHGKNKG